MQLVTIYWSQHFTTSNGSTQAGLVPYMQRLLYGAARRCRHDLFGTCEPVHEQRRGAYAVPPLYPAGLRTFCSPHRVPPPRPQQQLRKARSSSSCLYPHQIPLGSRFLRACPHRAEPIVPGSVRISSPGGRSLGKEDYRLRLGEAFDRQTATGFLSREFCVRKFKTSLVPSLPGQSARTRAVSVSPQPRRSHTVEAVSPAGRDRDLAWGQLLGRSAEQEQREL